MRTEQSKQITKRFLLCIDAIVTLGAAKNTIEVCTAIGLSIQQHQLLKYGARDVTLDKIYFLCEKYNTSVQFIVMGVEPMIQSTGKKEKPLQSTNDIVVDKILKLLRKYEIVTNETP